MIQTVLNRFHQFSMRMIILFRVLGLMLFCFGSFGCTSTEEVRTVVDDAMDEALNAKNTTFVNPDRLVDTKESTKTSRRSEKGETVIGSPVAPTIDIINTQKKFVVVNFQKEKIPAVGTELGVFRGEVKVGAIRITLPIKAPMASADIVSGDLQRGDVVR
jgi:hypothetical protein